MARRKRARKSKVKRRRKQPSARAIAKGYDFGIPLRTILLPDHSFVDHLGNANVLGCAYGWSTSATVGELFPSISLVAENGDSLRNAFEEFSRWAEVLGGDAVHMTIMTENAGGYRIGLSRDIDRFNTQCRFYDAMSEPLTMVPMWVKPIDTRNSMVDEFGEYLERLVSPFLLCGATAPRPSTSGDVPNKGSIVPLNGAEILKFECDFISEDDDESGAQSDVVLRMHRKQLRGDEEALGEVGMADATDLEPMRIFERRRRILEQNFPVTLHRLKTSEIGQDITRNLSNEGFELWQIEQAVCNLVTSQKIAPDTMHYGNVSRRKLKEKILEAVRERFESADASDDLAWMTQEILETQIEFDSVSLLQAIGVKPQKLQVSELQVTLENNGLLGEGVFVDP